MKNKIFLYSCSIFLLTGYIAFSQSTDELQSIKIIEKGIGFHDEKKYDEAIAEYKKVSRSDSNYVLAATELATTYCASGKDSMGLALSNDLLEIKSSYIPTILALKANALDNLKRPDEAIKVYEEGMKRFPLNYVFTYEIGISKLRQEKYKEAYDWFVKSIKVNPYRASTHYYLGYTAMKQGKQVQTMLAWLFYLTIDNQSQRAREVVLMLEKMAKNEFDFEPIVKVEALDDQDDFSEMETLVRSKVALDKKYKSQTKLKFNITKQIQLIMEKMEVVKNDKGFFMQFYAPFYLELYKKKMLEPFSYYILSGMENKEINGWVKSNIKEVNAFENWVVEYMSENISFYEENLNGKMVKAHHFYSKGNNIFSVGNYDSKRAEIGYWNYYYSNGIKKSEGGYNDKNQRQGVWKFYNADGVIKATETYVDGAIEGQVEIYYLNGSVNTRKNFSKNLLEGEQFIYYPTGVMKNSFQYKADVQNGKEKQFHPNGKLDYEVNVINGKYEGDLVQYYMDGHVRQKATFKGGERVGKYTRYYDYPENVVSEEGTYEKGKIAGAYKEYHKNGKVSDVGEFKDGEKNGSWKYYSEDNVLLSDETYNKGKNSGITKKYDYKGVLIEEFIYKNDMLQEYKAYAKDGKLINQSQKEGKNNYAVKLFYPNGNVRREGQVKNGELEGKWKNYHENGYITSEENFVAGKKEGKFYYYFENGKVQSEVEYAKNEENGYYKAYYKNGTLRKEGGYIDGNEVGEWKSYFIDGTLEDRNFYKDGSAFSWQQYYCANGKLDYEDLFELDYVKERIDYDTLGRRMQVSNLDKGTGVLDIKYADGKTHYKLNYVNDLKQGVYTIYYPNGKPYVIRNYVDNKQHGDYKAYYPSGQLKSEQKYVNGDLEGKSINYYENGNIESVYEYLHGKETGKSYIYYENKQLKTEYSYKNNVLEGKTIHYTETGEIVIVRNYEEGILISYQYTDKTGNLCAPIPVKNETGTIKAYFKTGTPSIEYVLKNGSIEGKRVQYFADGKIAEESTFVSDEREGPRKYYYPSGKLKQVENWKLDEKHGTNITYYENGKIKSEEFYRNGRRFGPVKKYNEKGELVKTYFYYDDDLINEK